MFERGKLAELLAELLKAMPAEATFCAIHVLRDGRVDFYAECQCYHIATVRTDMRHSGDPLLGPDAALRAEAWEVRAHG